MQTFAAFILPSIILFILIHGLIKRVPVYEEFVEGARDGFSMAVRIIPYLVAMLVAIAMFRASGAMDVVTGWLAPLFDWLGIPPDILTMAMMRPLTGSGSVGVLADLIHQHGENSLVVKMAATMFGSTETTFYVIAVYFGSVAIRRTAYAVQVGLLADLAGFIAAIVTCLWLFQ